MPPPPPRKFRPRPQGLLYNHHDPLQEHPFIASPPLRMTDEGREPWSRYVDLLIQEIDRLAGAASEDESCRQRTFFFWNVRSVPIGSMGLV